MVPADFLRLVYNSQCIVGNSSVAIRECAFLGVPAVNIGNRQTRRERGSNVIDVGYDRIAILDAILAQCKHGRYQTSPIYGTGEAGKKIAQFLSTTYPITEKQLMY